jgi:hypothetical protein
MLCRIADNRSSFLACIRKFSSLGMPGVLVHWFDDEFDLLLIRSPPGNNTNQAVATTRYRRSPLAPAPFSDMLSQQSISRQQKM